MFAEVRRRFNTEISRISALAVTGCENDPPEVREAFLREFCTDPKTQPIAGQMELGVHPVGFPDVKNVLPILQQTYIEGVRKDRQMLMDLVIGADRFELTAEMFKERVKKKWCQLL